MKVIRSLGLKDSKKVIRHISIDNNNKPICGGKRLFVEEEGKGIESVNCKKCLKLYERYIKIKYGNII